MVLKLIDVFRAYKAASEMGGLQLPYGLALALVRVKRATEGEALFFIERERELALEYADLGSDGGLRMASQGRFALKDPLKAGDYEAARAELCGTEVEFPEWLRSEAAAPGEIKPDWLDALEPFIEFAGG